MAAKDLGTKFVCFKCNAKFYDLKKPDPICPKCGSDQRESPALKAPAESRRGRSPAAAPRVIEPIEPTEDAEVFPEEGELEALADDDEDTDIPAGDDL